MWGGIPWVSHDVFLEQKVHLRDILNIKRPIENNYKNMESELGLHVNGLLKLGEAYKLLLSFFSFLGHAFPLAEQLRNFNPLFWFLIQLTQF